MKHAILLLLCLCVVACAPDRKLQRLLRKHPELARVDTIRDTVTVVVRDTIPGDTLWRVLPIHVHDTIRIDTGRLHVQLIRMAADTFMVNGGCDTVFVEKTVRVPFEKVVEKTVPCPEGYKNRVANWWRVVAIVLALVLAVYIYVNSRR